MKISLASPPIPASLKEGLTWVEKLGKEAAEEGCVIICFPESFLPGYPGMKYSIEDQEEETLKEALENVRQISLDNKIAIIIPMDFYLDNKLVNLAYVISEKGEILGYQTKNQLDPSEDNIWIPGTERNIFEIQGMKFGITICHEGFRYPELVRWAAIKGAQVVFHPHFTGSNTEGIILSEWGNKNNPYYEKAMMLRAMENTIFFASSNYASRFSESATSIIGPDGTCIAYKEYGKVGIITADIDLNQATGFLAKRFNSKNLS